MIVLAMPTYNVDNHIDSPNKSALIGKNITTENGKINVIIKRIERLKISIGYFAKLEKSYTIVMISMLLLVQNEMDAKMSLIAKKNQMAKNADTTKANILETVNTTPSLGVKILKNIIPNMSSPNPSSWIISATN